MNGRFAWFQSSASSIGREVDALFYVLLGVTCTVTVALAALIIGFAVKYRRGSGADRSGAPVRQNKRLEYAWIAAPLLIFLIVFGWSSRVYSRLYTPPQNALQIYAIGKQWMWKLEYQNGRREIDELHMPVGQAVQLIMTSQDVIHSFYIPAFRVKQDVLPGRYTSLWFTANRTGTFDLYCAELCGAEHAHMGGRVIVMPRDEFASWLESGNAEPGLANRGFTLYRQLGCSGCHEKASTVQAPELEDMFGRVVHLSNGESVVADENYLRDAIIEPDKHVVAGFAPLMPSYRGQVGEEDLVALIAYLKSLAAENRP